MTEEVTLFCQCLHNVHLMSSLDENLTETMGQSAVRILHGYVASEIDDDELSSTLYRGKTILKMSLMIFKSNITVQMFWEKDEFLSKTSNWRAFHKNDR